MAAAIAAVDIVTMGQGQNEMPLYVRKVKLWDKGAALVREWGLPRLADKLKELAG